jgi:hypothetical protein
MLVAEARRAYAALIRVHQPTSAVARTATLKLVCINHVRLSLRTGNRPLKALEGTVYAGRHLALRVQAVVVDSWWWCRI